MQNLVNFIFESNIQELKDLLINNINKLSIEDEKLIRKLTRLSSKAVYENILKWLDYSGLDKLKDTIMAKLEFLDIIEDLENAEIKPENEEEKRIVEEEVAGDNVQEKTEDNEKDTENTVDKVTEIMAVETQEEAK